MARRNTTKQTKTAKTSNAEKVRQKKREKIKAIFDKDIRGDLADELFSMTKEFYIDFMKEVRKAKDLPDDIIDEIEESIYFLRDNEDETDIPDGINSLASSCFLNEVATLLQTIQSLKYESED